MHELYDIPLGALFLADSWDMHDGGGWWVVMMAGMLLFWALIAALIVWVVRSRDTLGNGSRGDDPLRVLERRLAHGDISVEEYERRRALIRRS